MAASPIGLGHRDPHLVEIAERFVFVAQSEKLFDRRTSQFLSTTSLDRLYADRLKRASQQLLEWTRSAKVDGLCYRPGVDCTFVKENGAVWLNTWEPSPLCPQKGDWRHIGELLHYLFPSEVERNHVLDVLAFLVQHPGKKLSHALLIRGPQGSGKSTLAKLAALLVGEWNAKIVDGATLAGRFWNDLVNVQLLVIEEMSLAERWEVSHRIKTLITDRETRVEAKNVDFYTARTPDLIIVLSNLETPLSLEDSDRRFFVPEYGQMRREPEFYEALYRALPQEAPAFLADLLERDISRFRPDAPPPMTGAKCELIANAHTDLRQELDEMLREARGPFAADIVIPDEVVQELRIEGFRNATKAQVRRTLKAMGAVSCGQLPQWTSGCGRPWLGEPRVWAVRNQECWSSATAAELRDHLRLVRQSGHFSQFSVTPAASSESISGASNGETISDKSKK